MEAATSEALLIGIGAMSQFELQVQVECLRWSIPP